MSEALGFGIADSARAALRHLFEASPGLRTVWIFGSRARGAERPESDIDLAIDAPSWTLAEQARFASEIERMGLFYKVDLAFLQDALDAPFRAAIEGNRKRFWEPRPLAAQADEIGRTQLKSFQSTTLMQLDKYLAELVKHQARAPELLTCASLSAAELARQECQRYQSYTAGRPLTLRFVEGEDFLIEAPRELLTAVIGNLVRNACQYTLQGEVIVRLAGRALSVEDTGPGLPEAARARLQHLPIPAGLAGSSGTGLGLGLVQRICAYLGATLTYAVRPGGGTAMRIDFV